MSKVVFVPVLLLMCFIPGCARSRNNKPQPSLGLRGVPEAAELWRGGRGSMAFRAPSLGRVYVYDADDDVIAWTGTLQKGQRFNVDPSDDQITVDQDLAYHRILDPNHRHEIYFDKVK